MKNRIEALLSYCTKVEFGSVPLKDDQKEFYRELNGEILHLCKSLPEAIQTDALTFLMRFLSIPFGGELRFFGSYYVPTWSILYWLVRSSVDEKGFEPRDVHHAMTAHAMAMLLHALDDHMNDKEIPATHLTLLVRSQSWMIMLKALDKLAEGIEDGQKAVQGFLNDYYAGIRESDETGNLESYCALFRKQMATGLIVPVLMTRKMVRHQEFSRDVQILYGSFGVSWRLLDDVRDIEIDMMNHVHSSIYSCLPEDMRALWDEHTADELRERDGRAKTLLVYISEENVIGQLMERIQIELETATSIADRHNMEGLADEFRSLRRPLGNKPARNRSRRGQ